MSRSITMNRNENHLHTYICVRKTNLGVLNIISFFVGFISFVHFDFVGDFYPVEIVLALMVPFLWLRRSVLLRDSQVKIILFWGSLWLASQVCTDLFRNTPTIDLLRGWASIVFLLVDFVGLYLLVSGRVKRITLFILGYALGGFLQPSFFPSVYYSAHPWKFGYGLPVAFTMLLVITYFCRDSFRKLKWWVLPLVVLGGISFYLDFRSLGATILLTAFIVGFRHFWFGRMLAAQFRPIHAVITAIVLVSVVVGIIQIYGYSAEHGWLGENAKNKYEMQAGGKLGVLFGGRLESIASIHAVADSPIIGHGSWAKDPYYRDFFYDLIDLEYGVSNVQVERAIAMSDLIPAHSHIMQAWVWAGVCGAIFWFVILWIALRVMIKTYRFPGQLFVIVLFFSILTIWDILFSPFGAMMRMQWAFRLTLMLISYQQSQYIQKVS